MKKNVIAEEEIRIKAPVSRVWAALTQPRLIKQYFFDTNVHTDWQPGHPIRFTGEWEGKSYEDKGTVLAYEEEKMLRYDYWSSRGDLEDKPENYVIITYEVFGTDHEVTLRITQENIPGEDMKQHSIDNWKKVMNGLKEMVEVSSKKPAGGVSQ